MLTIDVAGREVMLPALAALGVAVGYVAGMFGIGGGFLLTPLLHVVFRIPLPIAVGSSLCQQIGTSIGSYLKHRQYGHGEPRVDVILLGASLIGVDAGTRLLERLEARGQVTVVLQVCYAVLLIGVILLTLLGSRGRGDGPVRPGPLARLRVPPYVDLPRVGLTRVSVPVLAYVGLVTGILSGLLGLGGGIALLPIMIHGFGFSVRNAAGTGILLLFGTVLFGTFGHALRHNVDLRVALAILAGSSIGAQLGVRSTARLPAKVLRRAFAGLLGLTVVVILVDLVVGLR